MQNSIFLNLNFEFSAISWSPVNIFASNLVHRQILPCEDYWGPKITLLLKFKMVAVWIKFDAPIK